MSVWVWFSVAVAGAFGALARYVVDSAVSDRRPGDTPLGTLAVNVTGSLVLGFLSGLVLYHAFPSTPQVILGGGVCGAYTTFSTFAFETVALAERREWRLAIGSVAVSVVGGTLAAAAGLVLAAL